MHFNIYCTFKIFLTTLWTKYHYAYFRDEETGSEIKPIAPGHKASRWQVVKIQIFSF